MCKIADQLKLCSCSVSLQGLKHYWTFHRYVENKRIDYYMGETILPFLFPVDTFNIAKLESLLNHGDIFDIAIHPQENDLLRLFFNCHDDKEKKQYAFVYSGQKWENKNINELFFDAKYDMESFGSISNGFDIHTETNM